MSDTTKRDKNYLQVTKVNKEDGLITIEMSTDIAMKFAIAMKGTAGGNFERIITSGIIECKNVKK